MSTESLLGQEEAGRRQPGSKELSELTASWPSPAVGASLGLSFLRGWAGGLMEPFMGRGCMGHQVLGSYLIPTQAHLPGARVWSVCSVQWPMPFSPSSEGSRVGLEEAGLPGGRLHSGLSQDVSPGSCSPSDGGPGADSRFSHFIILMTCFYSLILGFKSPTVDRSRDLVTSELPAQGVGRPA